MFLKGLGWTVGYITRSNASTPIIIFYGFFSIFSFILKQYIVWGQLSLLFGFAFIFVIIFMPNRLRSEKFNLEMKKMDLLGEKDKIMDINEITKVYQPQIEAPKKEKKK